MCVWTGPVFSRRAPACLNTALEMQTGSVDGCQVVRSFSFAMERGRSDCVLDGCGRFDKPIAGTKFA